MVLNSETFQGVEETGDMAQKTGDNLLPKHQQSTEKKERIVTATIHFLVVKVTTDHFCILDFPAAK